MAVEYGINRTNGHSLNVVFVLILKTEKGSRIKKNEDFFLILQLSFCQPVINFDSSYKFSFAYD